MTARTPAAEPIDIVVPAHNEGASIGGTLREFHRVVMLEGGVPVRFVVCEDGSTDDTVAVLRALASEIPLQLITEPARKGYTKAMVDGLRASRSALVAMMDSDGVYEPADFFRLLEAQKSADLVIGWRAPRRDNWYRLALSSAFGVIYKLLFPVRLHDPSCGFLIVTRQGLERVLAGRMGLFRQGFQWEFVARAQAVGLRIVELRVTHRDRASGGTQVYRLSRIPRIAVEHVGAMFTLRHELRESRRQHRRDGRTSPSIS